MNAEKQKFPAPEYAKNVLSECFEDAKSYFLDALIDVNYAHAIMLAEQGIITTQELKSILSALNKIDREKIQKTQYDGSFEDLFFLLQREIQKNCEQEDAAGKLHTARSRNDIDVTIYRMKLRDYNLKLLFELLRLRSNLINLADKYKDALMPAYTHTQPAQPTTLGHFLIAMVENLNRDTKRLISAFDNINTCPLGACAITTTGFPINRFRTAELLGFTAPTRNSYASISSVDYFTETMSAVIVLMINIGKFAYEFLLMAMQEFDVIHLSDGFVQGSSIMPQKRNPVALEHVRAIASKTLGQALGVMTAVHNTPFGDINDVEDDLQPLIYKAMHDAIRTINLFSATLKDASFNTSKLKQMAAENFITVTELADELVRRENLSFKIAHEIVGKAVTKALDSSNQLTIQILNEAAKETTNRELNLDEATLQEILSPEHFVNIRTIYGGPASEELTQSILFEKNQLDSDEAEIKQKQNQLINARKQLTRKVEELLHTRV
jgi:argininosuccinate lyase